MMSYTNVSLKNLSCNVTFLNKVEKNMLHQRHFWNGQLRTMKINILHKSTETLLFPFTPWKP